MTDGLRTGSVAAHLQSALLLPLLDGFGCLSMAGLEVLLDAAEGGEGIVHGSVREWRSIVDRPRRPVPGPTAEQNLQVFQDVSVFHEPSKVRGSGRGAPVHGGGIGDIRLRASIA